MAGPEDKSTVRPRVARQERRASAWTRSPEAHRKRCGPSQVRSCTAACVLHRRENSLTSVAGFGHAQERSGSDAGSAEEDLYATLPPLHTAFLVNHPYHCARAPSFHVLVLPLVDLLSPSDREQCESVDSDKQAFVIWLREWTKTLAFAAGQPLPMSVQVGCLLLL